MKKVVGFIHRIVASTKTEELFVHLRQRINFVRRFIPVSIRHRFASAGKFIPYSSQYPKNDSYTLTRDHTHFKINRSDYVQWRLFYGVRDNALKEGTQYIKNNSIVLDIGANFGAFSLRLARFAEQRGLTNFQIHAFEPNPEVQKMYKHNLSLNPSLTSFVQLHEAGLGSQTEQRTFTVDSVNTGAGRVIGSDHAGQFQVAIRRLDDFIDQIRPLHIAFIKLIVEGFEPEVLAGGWNTIQQYKPPLFIEVTRPWWNEHGYAVDEVVHKLANLGYTFMIEHHNEMLPYDAVRYASRFQFNLLCTVR